MSKKLNIVKELTEEMTTADMAIVDTPAMRIKRVNNFNPWGTATKNKENLTESMKSGLILKSEDIDEIIKFLENSDFYYEYNEGQDYLTFPEYEENYDTLEQEVSNFLNSKEKDINYSFEGIWDENESNSSDEAIYGNQDFEEDSFNREAGYLSEAFNELFIDEDLITIEEEGYEAALEGKGLSDCPYEIGTEQRAEWIEGYRNYSLVGSLNEGYEVHDQLIHLAVELWDEYKHASHRWNTSGRELLKLVAEKLFGPKVSDYSLKSIFPALRKLNVKKFANLLLAAKIIYKAPNEEEAVQEIQRRLGLQLIPKYQKVYVPEKTNKMKKANQEWLKEVSNSKLLLEGTYDDFLENNLTGINTALKKLRTLQKKVGRLPDDDAVYERAFKQLFANIQKIYDVEVLYFIERVVFQGHACTIDDLVKVGIEIENKYGTEPIQVLNAIGDVWVSSQRVPELKEAFNIKKDKFNLIEHNILNSNKQEKSFNFIIETNSHGNQEVKIDKKGFLNFLKENCNVENYFKNGIFEYKKYINSRPLHILESIIKEYIKESESEYSDEYNAAKDGPTYVDSADVNLASKKKAKTIEVTEAEPYEGFYSDANNETYYKDSRGNIYVEQGGEVYICTPSGEPDYPLSGVVLKKK